MKCVKARFVRDVEVSRPGDARPHRFRAGDVEYLYQWPDNDATWWTSSDLDWAYIVPASTVEVLRVVRQ